MPATTGLLTPPWHRRRAHAQARPAEAPRRRASCAPAFHDLAALVRAAGPRGEFNLVSVAATTAGPMALRLEVEVAPAASAPIATLLDDLESRLRALLPGAAVAVSCIAAI